MEDRRRPGKTTVLSTNLPSILTCPRAQPFFEALGKAMSSGKLGPINPKRVAFHGWSGGAQMVSNLADVWAAGMLPGIEMKAGVMMSGGSHQCYNVPPLAQARRLRCAGVRLPTGARPALHLL